MQWQPIETAPKQTRILLYWPWLRGHVLIGQRDWFGYWTAEGIVGPTTRGAEEGPTKWALVPDPPGVQLACPRCKGTGSIPNGTDEMACRDCTGTGVQLASPHVAVEAVRGVTGFDPTWEACEELCYCEPTKPCPKSVQLASNAHPEDLCQDCHGPNVVWFAPNDAWNAVVGSESGILCPACFIKRADAKGLYQGGGWQLIPELASSAEEGK